MVAQTDDYDIEGDETHFEAIFRGHCCVVKVEVLEVRRGMLQKGQRVNLLVPSPDGDQSYSVKILGFQKVKEEPKKSVYVICTLADPDP